MSGAAVSGSPNARRGVRLTTWGSPGDRRRWLMASAWRCRAGCSRRARRSRSSAGASSGWRKPGRPWSTLAPIRRPSAPTPLTCRMRIRAGRPSRPPATYAAACTPPWRARENPGARWPRPTQLDLDSWRSAFDNNVVATMLTLKYAAREMVPRGQRQLRRPSRPSVPPLAARFTSPISSAKAAVDQLCRIAASELGPSNVRVNVVRPGLVRRGPPGALPKEIERRLPVGCRPCAGWDVPVTSRTGVRSLVGPGGAWITGQVISVDGGQTVSRPFDASAWVEPVYGSRRHARCGLMDLAVREQLSIAISRELNDGEVVLTGAASAVPRPLAACLLAQALHAPSLTILGAGVYIDLRCASSPSSPRAGTAIPVAMRGHVGRFLRSHRTRDRRHVLRRHADRSLRIGQPALHPDGESACCAGPGCANSALGHTAARTILYTERHDRRTLVDEVDYASVIGHGRRGRSRAELGLPNAGPSALFTPDVLFRPDDRGMFVPARVLGPLEWDDVIARTGWPVPPGPPEAFEAEADEVRTLRRFVDPGGLLADRGT